MAQIAQQDNLVIKAGYIGEEQSDEVKKQLRRAYLRGTILDVVLDCDTDDSLVREKVKVIGVKEALDSEKMEIESISLSVVSAYEDRTYQIDCGIFQPEDYSDDVPYEGE